MNRRDNVIELLAPAKTADIGIAAIDHGADAVYIGGPSFGARTAAANSVRDIERLTRYAHRFDARIFLTLNTILRDDELDGARRLLWQAYEAGVDAVIVQDMGLLEIDLPPIELHASTQCDIRTPEKARFLQDVGFSQIVLARELTLEQIHDVAAATSCTLEFFVHGALCVAYSGQCYISHAHTGRSANRGECSQACRLPYQVTDDAGRVLAFDQHVLSMKDNDQSANLQALLDAGIRSFKIEGRYKDLGYVKNITAHYRQLLDAIIDDRAPGREAAAPWRRAASGRTRIFFTPDPQRNFNRGSTNYFVNGRQQDIGAFESPKHLGPAIGEVARVDATGFELESRVALHNADGLNYLNRKREPVGIHVNRARDLGGGRWHITPNEDMAALEDLRVGTELHRNRDHAWDTLLNRPSAERRVGLSMTLSETATGFELALRDERGREGRARIDLPKTLARQAEENDAHLRRGLDRLGATVFEPATITIDVSQPWFIPASQLNALRRGALAALEAAQAAQRVRPARAPAVEPPVPYPQDHLSYLANVLNHKARDFYARHGVRVIDAAYESHEELGDVSLMITKHCVRYSLSLCPKQAKGVVGVQGTVRAEPLTLVHGDERLTLRFDCKPCEMHVVGKIKRHVLREAQAQPLRFYRTRPTG